MFTTVVVPLDGMAFSEKAIPAGHRVGLGRQLAAPLRIVTVYEPVLADVRRSSHYTRLRRQPVDPDQYLDALRREVEGRWSTAVATASVADPVSVSAGLADHLANRPD